MFGIQPSSSVMASTAGEVKAPGGEQQINLTFLGTFYHDNNNEHNVDLIQFKEPVKLSGIRVIPLGATVNLSNGSFQLGATNPSELELEFYYNDLQDPAKTAFVMLEKFNYQEKRSIDCSCEKFEHEIFTDGILVRGLYSSLTLATYGYFVDRNKIQITTVPETVEENLNDIVEQKEDKSPVPESCEAEPIKKEVEEITESNEAERIEVKLDVKLGERESNKPAAINEIPQSIPTITTRFNTSPIAVQSQNKFEPVILNEEKVERVSSEEEQFDDTQDMDMDVDDQETSLEKTTKPLSIEAVLNEAEDISDEEIICEDEDEAFSEGSKDLSKHKSNDSVSSSVNNELKSLHEEGAADISHDVLSDQGDSFGEDLSEFVEQISDAELDEYTDEDVDTWDDFSLDALSIEYNPLSPSFKIRPLKKMSVESFVVKPTKADKPIRNQVIHNLRKYSEDSFKEALLELWVEAVEQTLPQLPTALDYIETDACDCVPILSFWVKLGLDLQLAKTHPSPPFIIRHLKVGLRLAELLGSFGGTYLESLFQTHVTILESLLAILGDEMIKTSIVQRLICQVLEKLLDSRRGWEGIMSLKAEEASFDKLEHFLQKTVEPRCANVAKNLVTKLTLACRCAALNDLALGIATGMKVNEMQWSRFRTGLDDLRLLVNEFLIHSETMLDLGSCKFAGYNPSVGLFRLLQEFEFMKSLATVLHYSEFHMENSDCICVAEILQCVSNSEIGLVYLCSEGETIKRVIKSLANYARDNHQIDTSSILISICLEIQILSEIDNIVGMPPWSHEETQEDNDSLQRLHALLSSGTGRDALVRVFSLGSQIRNILRILKDDDSDDKTNGIISLCRRGYGVPLLVHVVRFCDSADFIKKNCSEIHDTISNLREDLDEIEKLKELLPLLKTGLDPNNFTSGGLNALCRLLESLATDNFLVGSQGPDVLFGFTPEILAILRIFNGLARADEESLIRYKDTDIGGFNRKELECLRNCVELNSKDIVSICIKLLKKITSEFNLDTFLRVRLVGLRGDILVLFLLNIVKLLKKILTLVIESRKFDFQDLEPAEILIDLYGLLKHYPSSSKSLQKVAECSSYIVDTIGLFAISLPHVKTDQPSEDLKALKKCMWTRTISAIMKFILRSPSNVQFGLQLLLELLPETSPIKTDIPFSPSQNQEFAINRRRCGVYLHGVTEEIQEIVGTYCMTADISVLKKLRSVCFTLANLSASSCLMICRALIDKILQTAENDCEGSKPDVSASVLNPSERRDIYCSTETSNCLRFLSSLMRSSSNIKTGIMHVARASSKLDEKYGQFIGVLCSILSSDSSKTTSNSHLQAQEWVVSIFHSLCDVNNNLFGIGIGGNTSDIYPPEHIFANSIPAKENLSLITTALISLLQFEHLSFTTNTKLRKGLFSTLQVLVQTDYGFHHLKSSILNQSSQLHDYLERLVNGSRMERFDDATTAQVFEFVNLLHSMLHTKDLRVFPKSRQNVLKSFELRKCFIWSGDAKNHLLEQLRMNLQEAKSREIASGALFKTIEKLDDILASIRTEETEYVIKSEVSLPAPESLDTLFMRYLNINTTMADQESGIEVSDDESLQPELIATDLVEISQEVFSVDLSQLSTFYKIKDIGSMPGARNDLSEVKAAPLDDLNNFKSPMTGLGFGRKPITFHHHSHRGNMRGGYRSGPSGHNSRVGSHFDPFRSRPPNTSRPPSLHVDDFVAMESSSGSSSRVGPRPTPSAQDPYGGRGRGNRGSSRPYESDRPFRNQSQTNTPYYSRESTPRGRGSRGRGWGTESRSSPARGNYGGRPEPSGRVVGYGSSDDYRSTRSGSTGVGSSSGAGPPRNTGRYTRPYREAPPPSSGRSSSSSSSSWRDKPRSSYR